MKFFAYDGSLLEEDIPYLDKDNGEVVFIENLMPESYEAILAISGIPRLGISDLEIYASELIPICNPLKSARAIVNRLSEQ
ncbi:hypothetical protein K9L16_01130 [Candidatus Pacearchaeota archaeon]|nr:hypothetical protein [Candidatus Pacearchaeota archaeon]